MLLEAGPGEHGIPYSPGRKMNGMHSGFSFSSLRIIESLPAKEVQTGQQLAAYLSSTNPAIPVHYAQLHGREALFAELVQLVALARAGEIPIVHLEAHGNFNATGLVLASGETVLFSEIAPALREINLAARFNLVVFVAACGGGWFLEQVDPLQPGTCFGLVAPTDDIDPGEVMGGTRDFYRCLLTNLDAVAAIRLLRQRKLAHGAWYAQLAEIFFRDTVLTYVRTQCSKGALEMRARRMRRTAKASGVRPGRLGAYRRYLARTALDFSGDRFDSFFATALIRENTVRFKALRSALRRDIRRLLADGKFKP
jgi:hypothetical protein